MSRHVSAAPVLPHAAVAPSTPHGADVLLDVVSTPLAVSASVHLVVSDAVRHAVAVSLPAASVVPPVVYVSALPAASVVPPAVWLAVPLVVSGAVPPVVCVSAPPVYAVRPAAVCAPRVVSVSVPLAAAVCVVPPVVSVDAPPVVVVAVLSPAASGVEDGRTAAAAAGEIMSNISQDITHMCSFNKLSKYSVNFFLMKF